MKRLKTILCILLSSMFLLFAGACDKETSFLVENETFNISLQIEKTKFRDNTDEIEMELRIKIKKDVTLQYGDSPFLGFSVSAQCFDEVNQRQHSLYTSYGSSSLGMNDFKGTSWTLEQGETYIQHITVKAPHESYPQTGYRVYIIVLPVYAEHINDPWLQEVSISLEESIGRIDTGIVLGV